MPTLQSDIVGRVNRLPLRPNARNALLPLVEAISNSVDSITERMSGEAAKNGRIVVRVIRDTAADEMPIIGFDVEDNGVGFTAANFKSFLTPDSRRKERTGGKGVGRLAWLKVFQTITVDSVYFEDGELYRRRFNFRLAETEQIEDIVSDVGPIREPRTIISFRHFEGAFASRCPAKAGTIATRILSHFVPLFISGNAPKIVVDDYEMTDIETAFSENIVDQKTDKIALDIDGETIEFELWSLKCKKAVRFDIGGNNFVFLTAHKRAVLDYCIDEQLGLKALDGEFVYVGCAYGEYLDRHVNAERTGFTGDGSDIDQIKKAISKSAREYLSEYIERALQQKIETTREVVSENPQFLYVQDEIKDFARGLQPNAFKKEDIFVELSRNRFRRHRRFAGLGKEIANAPAVSKAIEEKINEYKAHVSQETKGALAEYVMRRKSVLDLFEKLLQYTANDDEPTYNREDAIHELICPMKADSKTITIDDHNLWLLDDRLAFFNFFASDKPIGQYANVESDERPDLAFFYDACIAWRETENSDAVIIVEFKRPMREDYSKGKDPVQQVLHYVKRLQEEHSIVDRSGRAIRGINLGTAFHCYVVVDITPQLEERIIGRFSKTPDGHGYFGYATNPNAYVEIVPYGKILNDARLRNTIFFQKLGITNATN